MKTHYEELVDKHGYCDGLVGKNEDGENVIVSIKKGYAAITTLQKNNWLRTNIYYPNGDEEELYNR